MKLKVSILVPLYKAEKYIEECLCSLFEQSYDNIEYILADDASPDDSINIARKVVRRYGLEQSVFFIRNEINQGVAYTRNTLINHANGDYIYFVDSDDFIERNTIEILIKNAIQEDADIVRCNYFKYYNGISTVINRKPYGKEDDILSQCLLNAYGMQSLCFLLIRRRLIVCNHLQFPDKINGCEDFLMTVKLFYYANKIVDTNIPLYHYRLDNNYSITHQKSDFYIDVIKAVKEIELFLSEKEIIEKYQDQLTQLKFISKQAFLLNKEIRDIKKYIYTYPESNRCYRLFNFNWRQKSLFFLAEHKFILAIRFLNYISDLL